jgi:heme-degrading monooxygenase HmoA
MPIIEKGQRALTFINIFTVQPDKQQELIRLLSSAAQQTMRHLPGFVSANIGRSVDGKKVVIHAQWESLADFQAMRKNPDATSYIQAIAALAQFEPVVCEVADTIEAASKEVN